MPIRSDERELSDSFYTYLLKQLSSTAQKAFKGAAALKNTTEWTTLRQSLLFPAPCFARVASFLSISNRSSDQRYHESKNS